MISFESSISSKTDSGFINFFVLLGLESYKGVFASNFYLLHYFEKCQVGALEFPENFVDSIDGYTWIKKVLNIVQLFCTPQMLKR